MFVSSLRNILLFVILFTSPIAYAGGGGECTPIESIPFVATGPGRYCLTDNINVDLQGGKAITIKSDNVHIDLSHFGLNNSVFRKGNTATGIYASGRNYLRVSNGTLSGWATGIRIDGPGSMENTVSSVHFSNIRKTGIEAKGIGLRFYKNRFVGIGSSTRYADAIAMDISGTSPQIIDNTIRNVMTNSGFGIGLRFTDTENPVIQGNYFDTISDPKLGCGLNLKSTINSLILRNNFQNIEQGIVLENDSTGLSNDTFMQGVNTPITGSGLIFIGHNF